MILSMNDRRIKTMRQGPWEYVQDAFLLRSILEGATIEAYWTGPAVGPPWCVGRSEIRMNLRRPDGRMMTFEWFTEATIPDPICARFRMAKQ